MYHEGHYFTESLLASLSEQVLCIYRLKPESVLEIGKGNGFVSEYLKKGGIPVTTFDINAGLEPDVVGDVTELDRHFSDDSFDWILCAEVLEHMPFEVAKSAIHKIAAVARTGAVLTIPRCQHTRLHIQGLLQVFFLRCWKKDVDIFFATKGKKISRLHHWEINHSEDTKLKRIREFLGEVFLVEKDWRSSRCPYHHFFVLRKDESVAKHR